MDLDTVAESISEMFNDISFFHAGGTIALNNPSWSGEPVAFGSLNSVKNMLAAFFMEQFASDRTIVDFSTFGSWYFKSRSNSDPWLPFDPALVDIVGRLVESTDILPFFEEMDDSCRGGEFTYLTRRLIRNEAHGQLRLEVSQINGELIRFLARHPDQMYNLTPRKFEELVAELLRDLGYETVLTPRSRDGGVDIRAFHKAPIGTILTLVECKKYSRECPVGVELVRSLRGIAELEHATSSMLVTTSRYTSGAKEFVKRVPYQMSLKSMEDLITWLRGYGRVTS